MQCSVSFFLLGVGRGKAEAIWGGWGVELVSKPKTNQKNCAQSRWRDTVYFMTLHLIAGQSTSCFMNTARVFTYVFEILRSLTWIWMSDRR